MVNPHIHPVNYIHITEASRYSTNLTGLEHTAGQTLDQHESTDSRRIRNLAYSTTSHQAQANIREAWV